MGDATTSLPAIVLWGSYHEATLLSISAGMYEVRFSDGTTRFATSAELLSPAAPIGPVPPQHLVLLPSEDATVYTRAAFVSAGSSADEWVVADGSGERRVGTSSVRLALSASAGSRAEATPLAVGGRVHSLRGQWEKAVVIGPPSLALGAFVRVEASGGAASTEGYVPSGTVVLQDDPNSEPPTAGTHALLLPPSKSSKGSGPSSFSEVEVVSLEDGGSATVCGVGGDTPAERVAPSRLRARAELTYRVLASTGGFQRCTLEAIGVECAPPARTSRGVTHHMPRCHSRLADALVPICLGAPARQMP